MAYPLFVEKGIAGTFYITINQVATAGYITWDNIATMAANGMDIECHTNTHPNLTTLTEAQVLAEYDAVDAAFVAHSLSAPRHTAYPWGTNNANVKTWTATKRDTARGVVAKVVGTNSDKFDLPSIDLTTSSMANFEVIQPMLDYIKANNLALIFLVHSIGLTGDMTAAQFEAIIDYCIAQGIDIITMPELYALMD